MRLSNKFVGVTLIVLILGAGGYYLLTKKASSGPPDAAASSGAPGSGSAASTASGAPDQKAEAAPLAVKVVPAVRGDLVMTLKSPGEAYTERKIAVKAEVAGAIRKFDLGEGRHVREGEIVLELDDQEYRLRLERLQAQRLKYLSDLFLEKQFASADKEVSPAVLDKLNKAQAAFEAAGSGFQKGLVSQADFERAQKDYELALIEAGRKKDEIMASSKGLTQAEIDVKISQMELEKTKIRAPFAGIVTDIKVSPRERLDAGRELFTLVDISRIKVKAKVLESEIGKMKAGREVDLRFSAYPAKSFKGVVEAVSPIVNSEDRTCAVHIGVANPGEELKPGMHAEVEIASDIYSGRLIVPQEAVLVRGGRKLVFVVEGPLAKWRYVQIGLENERFAEILEGVSEGEPVIVSGHFTLAHDAKVAAKQ